MPRQNGLTVSNHKVIQWLLGASSVKSNLLTLNNMSLIGCSVVVGLIFLSLIIGVWQVIGILILLYLISLILEAI